MAVQAWDRTHSFGYWLRRRRKALDLTQEALAGTVSCTRFTIRKIEADERRPSRRLAERLAQKLAVPEGERAAFLEAARAARGVETLVLDRVPVEAATQDESSPFVGRADEYGLLVALLARLTAGAGHVALIEGEPGIGKSRLMQALVECAAARQLATLATRCYEIERATAYQPVIDLVAQALERTPAAMLEKLPAVSVAELAALVPAIGERIGVDEILSGDFPQARQARLFQAVVQLLESAAGNRQLVVQVDDVQWADDASMQFLHYLARQAASRPWLLLCAYRDDELDGHERLPGLVASLRREAHARLIRLARFDIAAAEALVDGFADAKAAFPGLAARLHRETDGNPFFLVTMLHSLAHGEAPLDPAAALPVPDALRASVRARISHVDPAARAALDVAAVLGRPFDFEALLAAAGRTEEELLPALEMLVQRRLLRESGEEGIYDFSHDKVREVVYREIGAARRMTLHRAVAQALQSRGELDAGLAEHYERAHSWAEALRHALRAAERSQKLFAMRDALHWLDRAVALMESHPDTAGARELLELRSRRGAARALAGQTTGAVADISLVIEDARARGDREGARDALIQLGMAYRRADDYERATQCLKEALAESRAMNDERHVADTLYHLGTVMWSSGRNGEAIRFHAEAVEICERIGLEDLVAVQAYHGRGEAHFDNLEPTRAISCYERSLRLARTLCDRAYESENLMMIGFAHVGYLGVADYAQAESKFEAALAIAREADLQWHLGPILLGRDHVRACTGRHAEGWHGMSETLQWLESLGQTRYQLIAFDLMSCLLLDLGLDARAEAYCERGLALARRERIEFWQRRIEANLAIARLRRGDLDVGAPLANALAQCRRNSERTQMARCLEGLAELALARDDPAGCIAHATELHALVKPAGMKELAAQALRWRGEGLLASKDFAGARGDLAQALAIAEEIGRPPLLRDVHAALARVPATRGQRGAPREHATEAARITAHIGDSVAGTELSTA